MTFPLLSPETVRVLRDLNPWWEVPGRVRPEPPPYVRPATRAVLERLRSEGSLIEILRGPRQVGKTTAIYQIVRELVRTGTAGTDVLFVRFDHELLRETQGGIPAIARWFSREIRRAEFERKRPAFLFLDEVLKLRRWDEQTKHLFDTFPVRILLTGSSSVLVSKGGRESLAGRALTTDFPPFGFREVLEAWEPKLAAVLPEPVSIRALLDPRKTAAMARGLRVPPKRRSALDRHLERYYGRGGYPRLHSGEVPDDRWADYLVETVFERVLGVDIPDLFPVEQPALMRHLYLMVAKLTGREISQNGLTETANAAGFATNQPTVGKYLHYLADALLIREFRRYPLARRASARVPAKITLSDLGVRNALLRGAPSLWESPPDIVGPLVETLVQAVLRAPNMRFHYYRDFENPANRRSAVREVDFVAEETDGSVLPIEVKFRKRIDADDARSLGYFMDRFRSPCGILVTRETSGWDPARRIACVPLTEFLVRVGT
ncbi:MAG: ATP-binding protein [Planctomycetes bacterium]|nr:ATP-binding protein [Planctomycetota bacterium]